MPLPRPWRSQRSSASASPGLGRADRAASGVFRHRLPSVRGSPMSAARLLLVSTLVAFATAATSQAQQPSYARDVRPFLAKYCSECHNAKSAKASLNLETFKGLTAGGESGPVLVAGNPDKSPL